MAQAAQISPVVRTKLVTPERWHEPSNGLSSLVWS